jgi:hypothetical protein
MINCPGEAYSAFRAGIGRGRFPRREGHSIEIDGVSFFDDEGRL